jgi:hypothetical protein
MHHTIFDDIAEASKQAGCSFNEMVQAIRALSQAVDISFVQATNYLIDGYSGNAQVEEIQTQTLSSSVVETETPNQKCVLEFSTADDWYDNFLKNL